MLDPTFGLQILLDGRYPALWSSHERREVMRFLRKRGMDIPKKELTRLFKAILMGPQRESYGNMPDDEWEEICDRAIWLRLFKLKESGAQLPGYIHKRLDRTQRKYSWRLRGDNSEEFSVYMDSNWHGHEDENREILDFASMSDTEFTNWATAQKGKWGSRGGWVAFCKSHPAVSLEKLDKLSTQGFWPIALWYDALSQYSGKEGLTKKFHGQAAGVLVRMPPESMVKLDLMAARWLEGIHLSIRRKLLWELWMLIWEASKIGSFDGDLDFNAVFNHAGGVLTSVLLDELSKLHPTVRAGEYPGIPPKLSHYFDCIAKEDTSTGVLARTRLSSNLLYLFHVDPTWTTSALLARMDLCKIEFEASLWEGYLWSPRLQPDLLTVLKPLFLQILDALEKVPERVRSHAIQLFVVAAVSLDRGFSEGESKNVLYSLQPRYLADAAQTLKGLLRDAGDRAAALWRENIASWLKNVWPKHPMAQSSSVSEQLARMSIETGDAFPEAVLAIEKFLVPVKWIRSLYHLQQTDLPSRFPDSSLRLIDKLVGIETHVGGGTLKELLEVIVVNDPGLKDSARYAQLLSRI